MHDAGIDAQFLMLLASACILKDTMSAWKMKLLEGEEDTYYNSSYITVSGR
jgi:hypothetical protein